MRTARASHWRSVAVTAAVLLFVLALLPSSADTLMAEKALPGDPVFALVIKDGTVAQEQWRTTALYEVLQDPEMQEMLKPLINTLASLYEQGKAMSPVPFEPFSELLTGQFGLAVMIPMGPKGPSPVIQIVAQPKDVAKAEQAALDIVNAILALSNTPVPPKTGDTTTARAADGSAFSITSRDGVLVVTVGSATEAPVDNIHAATLARINGGQGGLADDVEYALVRKELQNDFIGWVYVGGLIWLNRNMPGMNPVAPFLSTAGLEGMRGIIGGVRIEDRGFRTRVFAHIEGGSGGTPWAAGPAVTQADLARIPSDSLAFSISTIDLKAIYDTIQKIAGLLGHSAEFDQAVGQIEAVLGASIRNEILSVFGNRIITFSPEPDSPARGTGIFISVVDRAKAASRIKAVMEAIVSTIENQAGPQINGFVKIDTLDRGEMTEVYPQSMIPGSVTPICAVADGWMGVGLSARFTLSATRHFLHHDASIMQRPDFAALLPKVPPQFNAITYTDVGACFGNLISEAQLLADLGAIGLKVAAAQHALPPGVSPEEIWSMDPGRFPDETAFRKKLFGSISVTAYRQDGIFFDSFSPVGPLPVPSSQSSLLTSYQGVATTSIMAGMLLPALARAREEARRVNCANNLRQIMVALISYQEPNQDSFPATLQALVPNYVADARVFRCPSTEGGRASDYAYVGGFSGRVAARLGPSVVVAYDLDGNHDGGRNAAYFDGHVKWLSEEQFSEDLQRSLKEMKDAFAAAGQKMPQSMIDFYNDAQEQ